MADVPPPTRRTTLTVAAWAVPALTVAAAAPALAASTGQQPWVADRWGVSVNPPAAPGSDYNLEISFQLDGGATRVPGDASIRAWIDGVEVVVANWHSFAWVSISSYDTLERTSFEVTATVEIAVPNEEVRTFTSPPVDVTVFPE